MNEQQKYEIIYDSEVISDFFEGLTPFNLKSDLKKLSKEELVKVIEEIGSLLIQGPHGKVFARLKTIDFNKQKIYSSKMRISNELKNQSSKDGFRCIVLIDELLCFCYLLHIYPKKEKTNITRKEENMLNRLLDEYVKSLRENHNE